MEISHFVWEVGWSIDKFLINYFKIHDDGDKEDLDCHECFAAMEQYRKTLSPLNLNSAFARH